MHWLFRPDSVTAFEDEGVVKALGRYVEVSTNRRPASFMIAKGIEVEPVSNPSMEELWRIHDEKMVNFTREKERIDGLKGMPELTAADHSLLDLKHAIADKILESCHFCERRCEANRSKGKKGFCNLDKGSRLSTEFLHMGEEACLVPSHTFFFVGCTFYCKFCQNWNISRQIEQGIPVTGKELAEAAKKRRVLEKSRNVNLVGGEPTPNLHAILDMLAHLDENVPVVWNSNMYMSTETMRLLNGVVDVYLADFKYGSDECAWRLSKAKNYFEVVPRNYLLGREHAELLIRHLVLPNHVECCTKPVIEWIAENLGNEARLNIMAQYHPEFEAFKEGDLIRGVSGEEMRRAFEMAKENGLWNLD
ncbi:MAG: radical SAM protein [Candidatus Hydrothermarchaeaceae archaeon]